MPLSNLTDKYGNPIRLKPFSWNIVDTSTVIRKSNSTSAIGLSTVVYLLVGVFMIGALTGALLTVYFIK